MFKRKRKSLCGLGRRQLLRRIAAECADALKNQTGTNLEQQSTSVENVAFVDDISKFQQVTLEMIPTRNTHVAMIQEVVM